MESNLTAVEWLEKKLIEAGLIFEVGEAIEIQQAKEMEKQQQGYSEEEVLNFTQTMIMQYKFGNTNIEQMDLLKETLQLFKNK
jgi:hypothetical protein